MQFLNRTLLALFKLTQISNGTLGISSLLRSIAIFLTSELDVQRVCFILNQDEKYQLMDDVSDQLRSDTPPSISPFSEASPLPYTVVKHALEQKKIIVLDDASESTLFLGDPYIVKNALKSLLCLPLNFQGKLLGAIYIENNRQSAFFSQQKSDDLSLFSALIAIAIGDAYLSQNLALSMKEKRDLERKLLISQRMDALGHLVGGVAHDFNNILNVIYGSAEYSLIELENSPLDELEGPLQESFELIIGSVDKAAGLARQLLLFSSHQVKPPISVNLNEVIESLDKMLQRLIGERFRLNLQLEASLFHIKADVTMMEQVLLNLVINARDAMHEGGDIQVSTRNIFENDELFSQHSEMATGEFVELRISDTGHGISSAVQKMIFEPFFTTKEVGKGTGLGLATTHSIVQQNNGYIFCDSTINEGTAFSIYLPRSKAKELNIKTSSIEPLPKGSETILLVDDEEVVRFVTAKLLSKLGYKVLQACSAEEALINYSDNFHEIDLLLTDIVMPGLNGVELAELFKQRYPKLAVICVSGFSDVELVEKYQLKQGDNFLLKPISINELSQVIRHMLDE